MAAIKDLGMHVSDEEGGKSRKRNLGKVDQFRFTSYLSSSWLA